MGGEVNTATRIRDRVNEKAGGRYQIDGSPFLVAVALHDLFQTDHEMETAMYGTHAVQMSIHTAAAELIRRNNGVFGANRESPLGRNRRLSAVAFLQHLLPSDPASAAVSVMVNPYPEHAWSPRFLPASRWFGEIESGGTDMEFGWRTVPDS